MHRGWATNTTLYDVVRDELVHQKVFGIHRLDRGTSGVVLFALSQETAREMQTQFETSSVRKEYIALVRGPLRDRSFINHPIRQPNDGRRLNAITEFIPIATRDRWTLVRALPLTGRSHQIRLHLKHISHPIVGDIKHGKGEINRMFREQFGLHRMALHAHRISFIHNGTNITLTCELPEDLVQPLLRLGFSESLFADL